MTYKEKKTLLVLVFCSMLSTPPNITILPSPLTVTAWKYTGNGSSIRSL